jgi:hypothetical protein
MGATALLPAVQDLDGRARDPFAHRAPAHVLLFVRSDCPITNRYAPELQRISSEFTTRGVDFWIVYADPSETAEAIRHHMAEYRLPGTALRDPEHSLVRRANATIAPEAAVFDSTGQLKYHGRIDDRYVDIGKTRPAPQTHDLEEAITAVLAGRAPAHASTQAVGCSLADVQ